jgi:cytochrome d ubiquinol oxidase subunit II
MEEFTTLQVIWFVLISVLWIGYFILEGFDFGVGILMKTLGRDENEKRAILHTIGPVWDGNEVWLLVAGGATFAAFPEWYATLFSGFYLALFVILVALIVRNVGFEFWGKRDSEAWRNGWEWCILLGSAVPALLWGVAWANIIGGTPIDANAEFTGNFFSLLSPYTLLGGLATLAIFFAHGAIFLEMRTEGIVNQRVRAVAARAIPVALVVAAGFLLWTVARQDPTQPVSAVVAGLAVLALVAATVVNARSAGRAFVATSLAIVAFFSALFVDLFPNTMVSSTSSAFNMTLNFSSSSDYTLTVMTVVAALLVPVVLAYQAWTYWVFRRRLSAEDFGDVKSPLDLLDERNRKGGDGADPDAGARQQPASP